LAELFERFRGDLAVIQARADRHTENVRPVIEQLRLEGFTSPGRTPLS
jgi:hypothetical protein